MVNMTAGDLVGIGATRTSQYRVVEIEGTHARILATLDAPGSYEFSMRLVDLVAWNK